MSKPKVSICVTTFNHERYIKECLDSILSQRVNFRIEIIVHDDASEDGTPAIIEDYARRNPSLIVPILRSVNCYGKDPFAPLMSCAMMATGEYLAICEGDDYWCDVEKLRIQSDILDNNNDATLVVGQGRIEYAGRLTSRVHCDHGSTLKSFQAQDVLDVQGQFAPTASYFCRKEIVAGALKLFQGAPIGDLFIEVYAGLHGKIIYCPRVFSVYRAETESSWSASILKDRVQRVSDYVDRMESVIRRYNADPELPTLAWDRKRAEMYCELAMAQLEEGRFEDLAWSVEKSVALESLSKKQTILYLARHSKIALGALRLMVPVVRDMRR